MSSELYLDKALWEQIERLRCLMGSDTEAAVAASGPAGGESIVVSESPKMTPEEAEDLEAKKARLTSILSASKDQWSEFFGSHDISNPMIDLSPISTAQENLPDHVEFDHDREMYVCTLCDIKTPSMTIMEGHLVGREHTRRLSYLDNNEHVEENLPEHVVWDNQISYYKCTLCDAKGATLEILDRHLNGKEHTRRLSYLQPNVNTEQLPDHVMYEETTQYYVCTLCDAKAATLYIMEGHLTGAKHLKRVEYEAEIVAAETELPPHIKFDKETQFFVCTLCDAKAATMYLMESHLGGKEHQRRLGYGEATWGTAVAKSAPLPSTDNSMVEGETKSNTNTDHGPMPEHVIWDNIIQYYVCTLCDAKAATEYIMEAHLTGDKHKKKLANLEWYRENGPSGGEGPTAHGDDMVDDATLPPYCVYEEKEQMYICKWCNKKSNCAELLTNHLRGKEHAKICSNLGIPGYGQVGHLAASKEYVDKYKYDVWARQDHWPLDTILDAGMHWKCVLCMKKFATPSAVNDHLPCIETYDQPSEPVAPPAKRRETKRPPPSQPALPRPALPVQEKKDFECYLCGSKWPSQDDLWFHEQKDPVHQELVRIAIGLLPKPASVKPPPVLDPRLEFFEI